ncbi:MAG TPA: choline-sulfatase [Geminicoccus sp.]|jgi:choline-sulfatase|uniref:choline-sulfatase n=1 Tax=Geminicoccus sp. TaxID=2024832 RepID=UPI002E3188F4|nr:choline-sulfatase [Geminicoccus sp.]HEX2526815.1 choline-sulfatase [Geminicoccus sp.]
MRPDILLFQVDQLAVRWLPMHGHPVVQAPTLMRLAEAGVLFENNYCNAPLCSPSRFSMLTGALPSRIGAYDNAADFPADLPTIAHYLRAAGYRTVLSGKTHFCGPDQLHGFEKRLTTDIYPSDYGWTPDWEQPEVRPSWYHNMVNVRDAGTAFRTNQLDYDEEVVQAARREIYDAARDNDGRPMFMMVSLTHPHDPYVQRPEFADRYDLAAIDLPAISAAAVPLDPHSARLRHVSAMDEFEITEDMVRRARRSYYASITYVDEQLRLILRALEETGRAERTVIVFTSDHGDMLGERGLWYKMSWFDPSSKVPLLVHAPFLFGPRHVPEVVSLVDVLPTLIDISETGPRHAAPLDGRSLMPHLTGSSDGHDEAIGEYLAEGAIAPLFMIRRNRWKFVSSLPDPDQLYDVAADPHEQFNLAHLPEHQDLVRQFQAELARHADPHALRAQVIASQKRRRLVDAAMRQGAWTSWDHQPVVDATTSYVRSHLVLDDLDAKKRWPPATS